ncbi:hypothetical protein [Rubellimicrobium aerolatum]|uniref:UmuC domain-containing protein n=1 Tax=Rubellimicrobium aerolatum TaxID=490979 RepID=A0ABW0SE08_9RHOB|nr:hypothetical protein [Rubellimicrobium aerolatum]MBP1806974.1 hypothetical protein [Rubellimicrobium aerolatum]
MTVFALVDGNSFYCSCERVFDPTLAKRPVIVLSNNDGFCNRAPAVKRVLGLRSSAHVIALSCSAARPRGRADLTCSSHGALGFCPWSARGPPHDRVPTRAEPICDSGLGLRQHTRHSGFTSRSSP